MSLWSVFLGFLQCISRTKKKRQNEGSETWNKMARQQAGETYSMCLASWRLSATSWAQEENMSCKMQQGGGADATDRVFSVSVEQRSITTSPTAELASLPPLGSAWLGKFSFRYMTHSIPQVHEPQKLLLRCTNSGLFKTWEMCLSVLT